MVHGSGIRPVGHERIDILDVPPYGHMQRGGAQGIPGVGVRAGRTLVGARLAGARLMDADLTQARIL